MQLKNQALKNWVVVSVIFPLEWLLKKIRLPSNKTLTDPYISHQMGSRKLIFPTAGLGCGYGICEFPWMYEQKIPRPAYWRHVTSPGYSAVINACSRWQLAMQIFGRAQRCRCTLDLIACNSCWEVRMNWELCFFGYIVEKNFLTCFRAGHGLFGFGVNGCNEYWRIVALMRPPILAQLALTLTGGCAKAKSSGRRQPQDEAWCLDASWSTTSYCFTVDVAPVQTLLPAFALRQPSPQRRCHLPKHHHTLQSPKQKGPVVVKPANWRPQALAVWVAWCI